MNEMHYSTSHSASIALNFKKTTDKQTEVPVSKKVAGKQIRVKPKPNKIIKRVIPIILLLKLKLFR
jgi:hypothetical protein